MYIKTAILAVVLSGISAITAAPAGENTFPARQETVDYTLCQQCVDYYKERACGNCEGYYCGYIDCASLPPVVFG